jgi:predicted nucleic-acid-binding Zn-ribbon protein
VKISGKCPKCGSHSVAKDAHVIDQAHANPNSELSVATYRNPTAWIFKGQQKSHISAWVCLKCGYVELYADDPGSLSVG